MHTFTFSIIIDSSTVPGLQSMIEVFVVWPIVCGLLSSVAALVIKQFMDVPLPLCVDWDLTYVWVVVFRRTQWRNGEENGGCEEESWWGAAGWWMFGDLIRALRQVWLSSYAQLCGAVSSHDWRSWGSFFLESFHSHPGIWVNSIPRLTLLWHLR